MFVLLSMYTVCYVIDLHYIVLILLILKCFAMMAHTYILYSYLEIATLSLSLLINNNRGYKRVIGQFMLYMKVK